MASGEQVAGRLGLVLGDRLAGGEFGAFRVTDGRGRAGVLKLLPGSPGFTAERVARAVELAARLRSAGYPVPEYRAVGCVDDQVYTLQELCPGEVPEVLTLGQAQRMVELCGLHAGAAPEGGIWPQYAVRTLREGAPGGLVDHGAVAASGAQGAALMREIAEVGARTEASVFRAHDIAHGDFHHRNLLVDGAGRVTAVFDWEGAHPGDRRLDLVHLAFWTEATGQPSAAWVRDQAREMVEPAAAAAMAALVAGSVLTFAVGARPGYLHWALSAVERILAPQWRQDLG